MKQHMIAYIKKQWKLLTVLLITIIVFFLLRVSRKSDIAPPSPPTPTHTPFELIETFPSSGRQETPISNLALLFTFSIEIDVSSAEITINPYIDFTSSVNPDGKTLAIYPSKEWKYDTQYKLTINIKSKDGQALENPIKFDFIPLQVTESKLDESLIGI